MRVWSIESRQQLSEFPIPNIIVDAKWAPDNRRLCVAGVQLPYDTRQNGPPPSYVLVFDTDTGENTRRLGSGSGRSTVVEWDSSGKRLVTSAASGGVACWDAIAGDQLASEVFGLGSVTSLAWTPDLLRIAVGHQDGQVNIIDAVTCDKLLTLRDAGLSLNRLTWCNGGRSLVGVDSAGSVLVWDASHAYEYARSDEYQVERLQRQVNRKSNFKEAIVLVDEWIRLRPDSILARMVRFSMYNRSKNYDALISDLKRLAELEPEHPLHRWNLQLFLARANRLDEAIADCTTQIEENGGAGGQALLMQALLMRARFYLRANRLEDAKNDMQLADERKEAWNYTLAYELALLQLHFGEVAKYSELCKSYIEHVNELHEYEANKIVEICAFAPNALDEYETAIEFAKRKYNPKNATGGGLAFGSILYRGGRYAEALTILSATIPKDTEMEKNIDYFIAMCHYKLGDKTEARNWLEKANAIFDTTPPNSRSIDRSDWGVQARSNLLRNEATKMIEGGK